MTTYTNDPQGRNLGALALDATLKSGDNKVQVVNSPLVVKPTEASAFAANYRLATRPYSLSWTFAAAGRKQIATLFHGDSSAKACRIVYASIKLESFTGNGTLSAELVRLTSAPSGGNPIIIPSAHVSGGIAEVAALALPTTPGTEDGLLEQNEYRPNNAGATSNATPPQPMAECLLCHACATACPIILRPGVAEGVAVVLDATVAGTARALVSIQFTEE